MSDERDEQGSEPVGAPENLPPDVVETLAQALASAIVNQYRKDHPTDGDA